MSGAALILLDSDGLVCRWPREAEAMTGIAADRAIGSALPTLFHETSASGRGLSDLGHVLKSNDGNVHIPVNASAKNGAATALQIEVHDLDRASRSDRAAFAVQLSLADDIAELQRMVEATAEIGHWRLELATQHIFWSEGAYRLHGFTPGSDIPLDRALEAYAPEDRSHVEKTLETALATGLPYSFRASLRRSDGVWRRVLVQGQPQMSPDTGEPVAIFGVIRDITAETRARGELIKARDEATAAAEANMMLLATMSHEIRTPLTGILGMLRTLRSDIGEEQREKLLNSVEGASNTLLTVLNDVLDHAKIESGSMTIESAPFDFVAVAETVIELFRPSAEEKQLAIEAHLPERLPVIGDAVRVQQILANFISNAIKFTASGSVELRVGESGDGAILAEVVDSGIGIAPDKLADLFEPFRQAEDSTARRFGGSGLGLAICRRLALAMEGDVGADSKPGAGSRFWFRVPLPRQSSEADRGEASDDAQDGLRGAPRILVVDDTETNRLVAESRLEALGARVETAANGLEGLRKLSEQDIDLIMIDGAMPILNGPETTALIRLLPPPLGGLPIVGCTSYSLAERRESMAESGMDGVLEKPLQSDHMVAIMQPLIDARMRGAAPVACGLPTASAHALADALDAKDGERVRGALASMADGDGASIGYAAFVSRLIERFDMGDLTWLGALTRRFAAQEDVGQ